MCETLQLDQACGRHGVQLSTKCVTAHTRQEPFAGKHGRRGVRGVWGGVGVWVWGICGLFRAVVESTTANYRCTVLAASSPFLEDQSVVRNGSSSWWTV